MKAETLNCPNCGAAISSESPRCQFCESKLATVACPSCFAMMFIGSRHCPHCGAAAAETKASSLSTLKCPKCKSDMLPITLGGSAMRDCESCGGLWLEVAAFEKICADREQHAAVLGLASPVTGHRMDPTSDKIKVRYVPCPQCAQLMNRMNFAKCSGVIVDVCRGHGTWFDRDELHSIIEFIRGGGLQLSRQKEKLEIETERQQLRYQQSITNKSAERFSFSDDERLSGILATSHVLEFLIDGK
jgi:Zn-finger nucleic acid-binding protein